MANSERNTLRRALDRLQSRFPQVFEMPETFRLQALRTECDTDRVVKRYGYRTNQEYFYPASTVKLCVAVAALHIMERLKQVSKGILKVIRV